MSPDLLFIIAAGAAFVAVAGVGLVLTGAGSNNRQAERMKAAVGAPMRRGRRQAAALDQSAQRKRQVQETLKELEERQKAERKKSLTLRARLEQAGLEWGPPQFWLMSGAFALVAALIGFIVFGNPIIAGAVTLAAGLGLPRWILVLLRGRRQKRFSENFADAIDIIVRGVKSGLPLNECLRVIARESPEPIASEFAEVVEGISVGVPLDEGMRRMCQRMPLPELNFFAIVLVIQAKTGGNLSEALGNLSGVLRSRKMMREKIAALSGEAKASAMIIGVLPPGVCGILYTLSPDYMGLMFSMPMGQLMLAGGAAWMGIGIFVMRGMINFKM